MFDNSSIFGMESAVSLCALCTSRSRALLVLRSGRGKSRCNISPRTRCIAVATITLLCTLSAPVSRARGGVHKFTKFRSAQNFGQQPAAATALRFQNRCCTCTFPLCIKLLLVITKKQQQHDRHIFCAMRRSSFSCRPQVTGRIEAPGASVKGLIMCSAC